LGNPKLNAIDSWIALCDQSVHLLRHPWQISGALCKSRSAIRSLACTTLLNPSKLSDFLGRVPLAKYKTRRDFLSPSDKGCSCCRAKLRTAVQKSATVAAG